MANSYSAANSQLRRQSQPLQPPTPTTPYQTLTSLSEIIESEVSYWLQYLKQPALTPDFSTIISPTSTATSEMKKAAVIHILETLPLRYRALVAAYPPNSDDGGEEEEEDTVVLPETLQMLLEQLKAGDGDVEFEGNDYRFFKSNKKFRQEVGKIDSEIRKLEKERMEGLRGLMDMVEDLKILDAGGLLGSEEVGLLGEMMDGLGLGGGGEDGGEGEQAGRRANGRSKVESSDEDTIVVAGRSEDGSSGR